MLTVRCCCMLFMSGVALSVRAETLSVKVLDQATNSVADAVVYALPTKPGSFAPARAEVVVDQIDKEFVHAVTVIRPGMSVVFPNHDNIRHHVYSFSPTKTFSLPLYKDVTPQPVRFDQPGVVALGCNIHDWMSAYIYVVDSPFTAVTDAQGQASLTLPSGQYQLHTWHPRLKNPDDKQFTQVTIQAKQNSTLALTIELKKNFKLIARSTPDGFEDGVYR